MNEKPSSEKAIDINVDISLSGQEDQRVSDLKNEIFQVELIAKQALAELKASQRMLTTSLDLQTTQSKKITRYRTFVSKVIPAIFENIPGVSISHLSKVFAEATRIIETEDSDLPADILHYCDELVSARETKENWEKQS